MERTESPTRSITLGAVGVCAGEVDVDRGGSGVGFVAFDDGGGAGVADDVGGDVLFVAVNEVSVRVGLGGAGVDVVEHVPADGAVGQVVLHVDHQDDQGAGGHGDADGFGDEPDLFHLRNDQAEGLGGAGGGQDDVVHGAPRFSQVGGPGLGRAVEHGLGAGRGVDRGHGRGQDPFRPEMVEQRFDHVGQAGGGAGGVGNDLVYPRVVILVIDAHDRGHGIIGHCPALILDFEGRGDYDLFGASLQVAQDRPLGIIGRSGRVEKLSGGVHDQPDVFAGPVDINRIAHGCQEFDVDAVDGDHGPVLVDILDDRPGPVAVQKSVQGTVRGVPFHIVRQIAQGTAHGPSHVHHQPVKKLAGEVVPQGQFTDTPQAVDPQPESRAVPVSIVHGSCSLSCWRISGRLSFLKTDPCRPSIPIQSPESNFLSINIT